MGDEERGRQVDTGESSSRHSTSPPLLDGLKGEAPTLLQHGVGRFEVHHDTNLRQVHRYRLDEVHLAGPRRRRLDFEKHSESDSTCGVPKPVTLRSHDTIAGKLRSRQHDG